MRYTLYNSLLRGSPRLSLGPATGPRFHAIATQWLSSQPSSTRVRWDGPFLAHLLAHCVCCCSLPCLGLAPADTTGKGFESALLRECQSQSADLGPAGALLSIHPTRSQSCEPRAPLCLRTLLRSTSAPMRRTLGPGSFGRRCTCRSNVPEQAGAPVRRVSVLTPTCRSVVLSQSDTPMCQISMLSLCEHWFPA